MYDQGFFHFIGMPYGLGWIFMILFWAIVIAGIIAFIRWLSWSISSEKTNQSAHTQKTPSDILRERYARGEINREEFLEGLEDLEQN